MTGNVQHGAPLVRQTRNILSSEASPLSPYNTVPALPGRSLLLVLQQNMKIVMHLTGKDLVSLFSWCRQLTWAGELHTLHRQQALILPAPAYRLAIPTSQHKSDSNGQIIFIEER